MAVLRVLFAMALLTTSAAYAAPPRDSPEYQRAIRNALSEFDAGNFPEARALFSTAHELYPNARTFRGLGFVEFELRNYVDTIDYLEAALSSDKKPLDGDVRRSTEELLARAREMIARVTLRVVPHAESLVVDGAPTALSDDGTLTLPVGDHVLEVRTTGFLTERRPLKVARGGELAVTIQLKRVDDEPSNGPRVASAAAAPADASRPSDATPARRAWYKSPWLWTSVAVVLVGAGVGTYFLLRPADSPGSAPPPTTANTPPGGVIQALRSF